MAEAPKTAKIPIEKTAVDEALVDKEPKTAVDEALVDKEPLMLIRNKMTAPFIFPRLKDGSLQQVRLGAGASCTMTETEFEARVENLTVKHFVDNGDLEVREA